MGAFSDRQRARSSPCRESSPPAPSAAPTRSSEQAQEILDRAIREKGEGAAVEFPNTGYFVPVIYAMTGREVRTLADFRPVMDEIKGLLPPPVSPRLWTPYLGQVLDAGMATLFAEEVIEACQYLVGPSPVRDIWLGAADDIILQGARHPVRRRDGPRLCRHRRRGARTSRRPSRSPASARSGACTSSWPPATTATPLPSNWMRAACNWAGTRASCRSGRTFRPPSTPWALPSGRR